MKMRLSFALYALPFVIRLKLKLFHASFLRFFFVVVHRFGVVEMKMTFRIENRFFFSSLLFEGLRQFGDRH